MAGKRRRSGAEVTQKGKDGKRRRSFHRGIAQGKVNDRLLVNVLEPAFAAAAEDRDAGRVAAAAHRRDTLDYVRLVDGLARVSPCAGLLLPDPLL